MVSEQVKKVKHTEFYLKLKAVSEHVDNFPVWKRNSVRSTVNHKIHKIGVR